MGLQESEGNNGIMRGAANISEYVKHVCPPMPHLAAAVGADMLPRGVPTCKEGSGSTNG